MATEHIHIWRRHKGGRGLLTVRVCLECHEPEWDDLDRQLDALLMRYGEVVAVKLHARWLDKLRRSITP